VHSLLVNPETDWSKVDIDAPRQHLIDMNDVSMRAQAREVQAPEALTFWRPAQGGRCQRPSA
jgi:hypothetical protein